MIPTTDYIKEFLDLHREGYEAAIRAALSIPEKAQEFYTRYELPVGDVEAAVRHSMTEWVELSLPIHSNMRVLVKQKKGLLKLIPKRRSKPKGKNSSRRS